MTPISAVPTGGERDPKARVVEVWACPWVLRSSYLGLNARCGHIQNSRGTCPYDHPEEVDLVQVASVSWPPDRDPEVLRPVPSNAARLSTRTVS